MSSWMRLGVACSAPPAGTGRAGEGEGERHAVARGLAVGATTRALQGQQHARKLPCCSAAAALGQQQPSGLPPQRWRTQLLNGVHKSGVQCRRPAQPLLRACGACGAGRWLWLGGAAGRQAYTCSRAAAGGRAPCKWARQGRAAQARMRDVRGAAHLADLPPAAAPACPAASCLLPAGMGRPALAASPGQAHWRLGRPGRRRHRCRLLARMPAGPEASAAATLPPQCRGTAHPPGKAAPRGCMWQRPAAGCEGGRQVSASGGSCNAWAPQRLPSGCTHPAARCVTSREGRRGQRRREQEDPAEHHLHRRLQARPLVR